MIDAAVGVSQMQPYQKSIPIIEMTEKSDYRESVLRKKNLLYRVNEPSIILNRSLAATSDYVADCRELNPRNRRQSAIIGDFASE
uniref:Uncharacterized protein n=1 Tax=Romanomermis culicivorax TaxID=13658 RepID=A0A915K3Z8_ROMCU